MPDRRPVDPELLAHFTGKLEIRFSHRESDVIAAPLMGGLNDQVHIDVRLGKGFEQAGGDTGLIGNVGQTSGCPSTSSIPSTGPPAPGPLLLIGRAERLVIRVPGASLQLERTTRFTP